jgi:hypothetical protein
MQKQVLSIVLNWLALAGVLTVNTLANTLPINGFNTGEISAMYPNLFVPAGFTFSIWGVIYLLLLIYNIQSTRVVLANTGSAEYRLVQKINPFYLLTCLLNMCWIFVWHYLQVGLSLVIMIAFLAVLIGLFLSSRKHVPLISKANRLMLQLPFVVYLGWISAATIANSTALLVSVSWNGMGIEPGIWSSFFSIVALLLGLWFTWKEKQPAYTLVIAWALWGIYKGQMENNETVGHTALVGSALLASVSLFYWLTRKRYF